jgi:hypothetical protein
MRTPQRLQMQARCLVLRTGTFLNIVAINIFIADSLIDWDVPAIEQWGGHAPSKAKKLNVFFDFHRFSGARRHPDGTKLYAEVRQVCSTLDNSVQIARLARESLWWLNVTT